MAGKPAERRACGRFTVPGAHVAFSEDGGWGFRKRRLSEQRCELRDLCRGGVRFIAHGEPPAGQRLSLVITVPGEPEPLQLESRVAWSLFNTSGTYHVAVAFTPYGSAPGDNDPAILDRLVEIEDRYLAGPPSPGDDSAPVASGA